MKINHYLGGIFLVSGTAIGGGLLVLPVTTSLMGFCPAIFMFIVCWLCMLATAFFLLDVNLAMKGEPNIISMAGRTLGIWGKGLSWVFYLLLLYSLIAAYISGSAPFFEQAVHAITGWEMPSWLGFFLLPLIFGSFVYFGVEGVDIVNRILMVGLIGSYLLLIGFLPQHIQLDLLAHVDWKPFAFGIPAAVTAFGYHVIIPTLSTYMDHDRVKLKRVLIIGSLLPLVFYLIWEALVLGVVPLSGLVDAWKAGSSSTEPLSNMLKNPWVSKSAQFFSFFALTTSFLGLAVSLSDFLTDGLKIKKSWEGKLMAIGLTFIPPLVFVFTYSRGFIVALEYAGAFVAVLLWFLPAVMAWKLKKPRFYTTVRARVLMVIIIILAFGIVIFDVLEQLGYLQPLISRYVPA